ncbi:aminoglycoside 3-N-acetyltransferase [Spirosoma montaniterrae]|uniref:Aminoglycoside N(3)-acetyltransferase n=1 Tax=Spirosoma montaniterrae TaxID=1178516 RepID=A0A1P9WZM6_9BACT|nr:aminoglycoside 3-N-acetyltransferase [Spirosoma montaniterrae]AQG80841.1 aminoglycoside 3-N-acetyltransferase [Spirosoma montaniterrae]
MHAYSSTLPVGDTAYWTRYALGKHLQQIGLQPGDAVMVHAGLRAIGPMLNGPDTLIDALLDTVGPTGTLLCYVNWEQQYEDALDEEGRIPDALKPHIPPFDPARSRASRDHGAFAEFVRTTPGAQRSGNPGASVAAIGGRANWFTANHPLDYGYGPNSPFARLVSAAGNVLMIGCPLDTMSLLHHAEHLAQIPGKHSCRMEVPLLLSGQTLWRMIEEFDTAEPVVDGLEPDYFGTIVDEFLVAGNGRRGQVGNAPAVLVPAADMVAFAVDWLEQRFG